MKTLHQDLLENKRFQVDTIISDIFKRRNI